MDELEFMDAKKLKKEEEKEKVMREMPRIGYIKPKHKITDDALGGIKMISVATYSTLMKGAEIYKNSNEKEKKNKKKEKNAAVDMVERANRWFE